MIAHLHRFRTFDQVKNTKGTEYIGCIYIRLTLVRSLRISCTAEEPSAKYSKISTSQRHIASVLIFWGMQRIRISQQATPGMEKFPHLPQTTVFWFRSIRLYIRNAQYFGSDGLLGNRDSRLCENTVHFSSEGCLS